ncbi:MAG: hypothetical protein QW318_06805 [Candidatus Caldarchaeum sp.]
MSYVAAMLYAHVLRDHAPPSPPITISIDAFKAYVKELGVIDMIGEEEVEPYLSMLAKLGFIEKYENNKITIHEEGWELLNSHWFELRKSWLRKISIVNELLSKIEDSLTVSRGSPNRAGENTVKLVLTAPPTASMTIVFMFDTSGR